MPTSTTPCIVVQATPSSLSSRAQDLHERVRAFVQTRVIPCEQEFVAHASDTRTKWTSWPRMEALKAEAKGEGLWNLFIPLEADPQQNFGAGLTNAEYAHIAEETGKSLIAPEVFNCSAPDTGNMEVLLQHGTASQRETWLMPLLQGEIRSCFAMTEPPDVTTTSSITRDGDDYVINGVKWWISGSMDPRCKICLFMGKTDRTLERRRQQSLVLVPMGEFHD